MVIEILKNEQEKLAKEEQLEKTGEAVEEKEAITMVEIMHDEKKSALLAKMVEYSDEPGAGTELMKRLAEGKLNDGDVDAIEALRADFQNRMDKAEALKENIDSDLIVSMGAESGEWKGILNIVGSEKSLEMVKNQMLELAATNPEAFGILSEKMETMKAFKEGGYKEVDVSIEKMCVEKNIDAGEYLKALAIEKKSDREVALKELVRQSWGDGIMGKFWRAADTALVFANGPKKKGFGSEDMKELIKQKGSVEKAIAELDKQKNGIGQFLAATVKEDPGMREALSRTVMGESVENTSKTLVIESAREVFPDNKAIDGEWDNYKKEIDKKSKIKWDAFSIKEKNKAKDTFSKKLKSRAQKNSKDGFWAAIFAALFPSRLAEKMKTLE